MSGVMRVGKASQCRSLDQGCDDPETGRLFRPAANVRCWVGSSHSTFALIDINLAAGSPHSAGSHFDQNPLKKISSEAS